MSAEQQDAAIRKISKECEVPTSWFFIKGRNELHFRPARDANYSRVDCALKRLRPYNPFMGFVGNETYHPEIK
jgi:hypothetical protein